MKTQNVTLIGKCGLVAACLAFSPAMADAKGDKGDKGKGGKGGKPEHSEKGKGGKPDHSEKGKGGKPDKEFKKEAKEAHKDAKKWRENRFRDDDRTGVLGYFSKFRDNEMGLPPGLAKNYRNGKPLPPGWQKKVNNGYVIEDEWSPYFHPMEDDAFPFLQKVPDTRLYWYGDRVVRVYEPRREVIDVIQIPTIRLN